MDALRVLAREFPRALPAALEERVALARKLWREALDRGRARAAESWARKPRDFEREAGVIRDSIRRVDEIAALAARD